MKRLAVFGAALGSTVLLGAALGASWQAAAQQEDVAAESTLLQVSLPDIAGVGMPGFSGSLGHLEEDPGTHVATWDQQDPEGVLSHVGGWHGGPAPPGTTTVQVTDPAGSRQASANWSGFGVRLSADSERNVISFGALSTWARCTHSPLAPTAEASAATDSNAVYLFDDPTRPLAEGPNEVTATGEELGLPGVSTADLTITVRHAAENDGTTARAAVVVELAGVLRGPDGGVLHEGPLGSIAAGGLRVDCSDQEPPTTTPQPPPGPTTTQPPTLTPHPPPTSTTHEPPSTTPRPPSTTTEPEGPGPTGSGSAEPGVPTSDGPPPHEQQPEELAQTGSTPWPWALTALVLLLLGTTGVVLGRQR
ncbi:hypothetical protein [Salinifilum ghardaiensis]